MRIGFDLDGTVADLQGALARTARGLFPDVDPSTLPRSFGQEGKLPGSGESSDNRSASPADGGQSGQGGQGGQGLTGRQQRDLWREVCARINFWETLDEIEPGALERLYAVAQERRWELIFLTSRPESAGDTAQAQSHRWLIAHGFRSPSVFVVHGSRGKIADALQLDVLVDDRPENCLDVAIDSKARAILVWRGGEDKVPGSARQLGIGAVGSIAQCLDILVEVDRPDEADDGVVERFKRLLGLKSRAPRDRDQRRSEPTVGGRPPTY